MSTPRVAWHPTSQFLFCTSDNMCVFVWNVRSELILARIARHSNKVRDIACWAPAPTGTTDVHKAFLCSGSFDKTMQLWEVSWRD
jgi:WD40 repeat protein